MHLNKSGIPQTIRTQNPSSTEKDWNPVHGIRNPRRGVQNPRRSRIPLCGANLQTGFILGSEKDIIAHVSRRFYILFVAVY